MNEILLRRKHMIIPKNLDINDDSEYKNAREVLTIMKNVESLGFTFSKELYDALRPYSSYDLHAFGCELIYNLKRYVGADKEYSPMYPNFPQQVIEMDDFELHLNAILHYWTFGQWKPEYQKDTRLPLIDSKELTVLTIGTDNDLMQIFTNLVSSKTSLSVQDKEDIEWFFKNRVDYFRYMPDEIPLKENCALIGKIMIEKSPIKDASYIQKYFKTATDVLRLLTCMSDGDISLADNCKFRNLKRSERRMIMDLLAGCGNILEDMYRYKNRWIRAGEIIHPFEYHSQKHENVKKAFNVIRNGKKPLMFAGKVEQAIQNGDVIAAIELLKNRPGELTRRLDHLLRISKTDSDRVKIINGFSEVAGQVSTPVLLQVMQHFKERE